jgi:uncharacterized protein YqeY
MKNKPTTGSSTLTLPFHTFRNISCTEDIENNRKVCVGYLPLSAILDLPTDENVRDFLVTAEGKKRQRYTQVHNAILETLSERPDIFSVLNGGITIVANDVEVIDKDNNKLLTLSNPSIINGSQTQGVVKDFVEKNRNVVEKYHIKYELIITSDTDLIAEISISRNYQNEVMGVSIAGRRGQLDELETALRTKYPHLNLRKSETDLKETDVDTEKLIQVIAALTPKEIWPKSNELDDPNKVYTYSMKAKCLKDFQEMYKRAKDPDHPEYQKNQKLYQYYLDIAPNAYDLYNNWKTHRGFEGTGLRSIVRDGNRVVEVPDGIIFPVIASLSVFVKQHKKKWSLDVPTSLQDGELIRVAKRTYMESAKSNPQTMGKTKACYSALYEITSIYQRLLSQ